MSRTLWVDGTQGASGDMLLGAFLDLGVDEARLREILSSLPLEPWRMEVRRVERCGLSALRVEIACEEVHERTLGDVRSILTRGELPDAARARALAVFERLFDAEARVHGRPLEAVHLHEAGATDALIDVVGSCLALEELAADRIVVSRLTTGWGEVRCAHGLYPVPGPATTWLVRDVPVTGGALEVERLTPTGAAILTTIASAWGPLPPMRPRAVGHGAGSRELGEVPNVLRLVLGEDDAAPGAGRAEVSVIECAVDDMTPQAVAHAAERWLAAGALDVMVVPVIMKKGRPGQLFTVLARPSDTERMIEHVLRDTSTLGLRWRTDRRVELAREERSVATRFGAMRVKIGRLDGRILRVWPEYEDCAAAAERAGVSLWEVQREALASFDREAD